MTTKPTYDDLCAALEELLCMGIECTCCGQSAPAQCDDHDDGYGVCESCLKRYGRTSFCHVDCRTHGPKES